MKAIVQTGYGPPSEVLVLREVAAPVPGDGDVLIRVHAASLHVGDYFTVRGRPYLARFAVGFPKPRADHVIGLDLAGRVEAVGRNVKRFRPGEEVFAECGIGASGSGACAEYARAPEDNVVVKPRDLTFAQAAAIPVSGLAALHGLRDAGKVRPGHKVLINGAAGGVGTYAVQIAKWLGAEVTGVCSTRNVDVVRSLGADHVIDYTVEDFTRGGERYDLILDNVGNHKLADCWRVLESDGRHLPNSGRAGMGYMLKAFALSAFVRKQGRPFLSEPNSADLELLRDLVESGAVRPVLWESYPLSEAPAALAQIGDGHVLGKVVIAVHPPEERPRV